MRGYEYMRDILIQNFCSPLHSPLPTFMSVSRVSLTFLPSSSTLRDREFPDMRKYFVGVRVVTVVVLDLD